MKKFETLTDYEILNATYSYYLLKWGDELDFLEKNPDDIIAKSKSTEIDVAKNSDYSNLDGCKTAEECAYSIGTPHAEPRTASHTATQLTKAE